MPSTGYRERTGRHSCPNCPCRARTGSCDIRGTCACSSAAPHRPSGASAVRRGGLKTVLCVIRVLSQCATAITCRQLISTTVCTISDVVNAYEVGTTRHPCKYLQTGNQIYRRVPTRTRPRHQPHPFVLREALLQKSVEHLRYVHTYMLCHHVNTLYKTSRQAGMMMAPSVYI